MTPDHSNVSVRTLRRGSIAASRVSGTPTTYTLFPTVNGRAYSASINGTGLGADADYLSVGRSTYYFETFLAFDTSTVLGTITSATLSLYGSYDSSPTDFTVEARAYDFGATITTADYLPGTSLAALTLLASRSTAGFTTSGYNAFTSEAAFLSNINQAGTTRLIINSSLHRLGDTTDNRIVEFFTIAEAGTTKDPKLVIESLV